MNKVNSVVRVSRWPESSLTLASAGKQILRDQRRPSTRGLELGGDGSQFHCS